MFDFKKNIVFSIITVAAFFILVELVGHTVYFFMNKAPLWQIGSSNESGFFRARAVDTNKFTIYGSWEYRPNTEIKLPTWYPARSLYTDINGLVHNGYNKPVSRDDYCIVMFGGSTLEGRGASSNSKTIAAVLEQILQAKFPGRNIRVLNVGHCGDTSYLEFCRLQGKVLQNFHPKMTITFDGRNDAFNGILYSKKWKPNWIPYFDELDADINAVMQGRYGSHISPFLIKYSFIAAFLDAAISKIKRESQETAGSHHGREVTAAHMEMVARNFLDNHLLFFTKSNSIGAKHYSFLQPVLLRSKKVFNRKEERLWNAEKVRHGNPFFWKNMEDFYDAVKKDISKTDYFYDISDIFIDTSEEVYWDSCHYTDTGNEIIAGKIAEIIEPELLLE